MAGAINIKSKGKTELIDITEEVNKAIRDSGVRSGVCYLYVPHTTAGIAINEGADPAVKRDILTTLTRLVPFEGDYHHSEGNSAAHVKASIIGPSVFVLVEEAKPVLGTWQSIYFCEFDGPRHRRVLLKII